MSQNYRKSNNYILRGTGLRKTAKTVLTLNFKILPYLLSAMKKRTEKSEMFFLSQSSCLSNHNASIFKQQTKQQNYCYNRKKLKHHTHIKLYYYRIRHANGQSSPCILKSLFYSIIIISTGDGCVKI